jgi:hypothetical protein
MDVREMVPSSGCNSDICVIRQKQSAKNSGGRHRVQLNSRMSFSWFAYVP